MRMFVVRLNPDSREGPPYSRYPTAEEYEHVWRSSPMDGFHEAVNFHSENGVIRGYLPPRHRREMRDGKPFTLVSITAKTATDEIVGVQSGCRYVGRSARGGRGTALDLTWHYYCPASLSMLLPKPVPHARKIVLGRKETWARGPTFIAKHASRQRIAEAILASVKRAADKRKIERLLKGSEIASGRLDLDIEADFEAEVSKQIKKPLGNVKGNPNPLQREVRSLQYVRDPKVVAYVLRQSKGKCFDCKQEGPFVSRATGLPYLEVHHIEMLKEGGADTVENAIALCPNCHRKRHHG